LVVPVTNSGNVLIKPKGELRITGSDGKEIIRSSIEMGSVYGGSATTIELSLPDQIPFGEYQVSVKLADEETGAKDGIEHARATLVKQEAAEAPTFVVDPVSVTANADPVQYAQVTATVTNNGQAIATANVTLNVERDGKVVESYPLAQNQALPDG